jgi:predicted transcriptional regulator
MERAMRALYKGVFGAACVVAVTAMTASSASAFIVCNKDGACWRVQKRYHYRPEFGLTVRPDSWKWGPSENYRWREPGQGPGYWRSGVWMDLDED